MKSSLTSFNKSNRTIVPWTFGASTSSTTFFVMVLIRHGLTMPAAWNTPLMAWNFPSVSATTRRICLRSEASAANTSTSAPRRSISRSSLMILVTASGASFEFDNSFHFDFSGNAVFFVSTILAWQVLARYFANANPSPPVPPVIT